MFKQTEMSYAKSMSFVEVLFSHRKSYSRLWLTQNFSDYDKQCLWQKYLHVQNNSTRLRCRRTLT
ncbi:hypothetical protein T11_9198 [Trichinella zimbabwensis]|uniref:Uncharacterized protein n=1 Tax=Trichinella zimbabwensis TaxID=268475 RepID=A0A0V1HMC4_9BILA|nr:hypothetical protein T11_9198 [Trichinella zimbabwensis]